MTVLLTVLLLSENKKFSIYAGHSLFINGTYPKSFKAVDLHGSAAFLLPFSVGCYTKVSHMA